MSTARIIGTVPAAPMGLNTMEDGKKKIQNAVARTRNGTLPRTLGSRRIPMAPASRWMLVDVHFAENALRRSLHAESQAPSVAVADRCSRCVAGAEQTRSISWETRLDGVRQSLPFGCGEKQGPALDVRCDTAPRVLGRLPRASAGIQIASGADRSARAERMVVHDWYVSGSHQFLGNQRDIGEGEGDAGDRPVVQLR